MDQANYLDLSQRLLHRSGQLAYFQSIVEFDNKKHPFCTSSWSGNSSDGRFFITRDRLMDADDEPNYTWQDVFSNKKCCIKISAINEHRFWPLTSDTGLLIEIIERDDNWNIVKFSLSLMELDWAEKEIRKIHNLSFEDQQRHLSSHEITIDAMDPTRFLLQFGYNDGSVTLKIGHVRNNEISLGENILIADQKIWDRVSFGGNTLYSFYSLEGGIQIFMDVTHLDQTALTSKTSIVVLDAIPEQVSFFKREYNLGIGCNAIERVYLVVQHEKTKHYGVIWASLETRKWELLNFYTIEPISHIKFMPDGQFFWIQTTEMTKMISGARQLKKTFYRVPLKKPEKLSDLAWFSLIRSKSKLEGIDPYEEAQKYLPYYSEIRSPWEE